MSNVDYSQRITKLVAIANPMTEHNPNIQAGSKNHDPLSSISQMIIRDSSTDQQLLNTYKTIEGQALQRLDFQYPVEQMAIARTATLQYNIARKRNLGGSLFCRILLLSMIFQVENIQDHSITQHKTIRLRLYTLSFESYY